MKTVTDWSKRPEPWCWVGPQFRAECEAIAKASVGAGERLRRRRIALGVSKEELARLTATPAWKIGRVESAEAESDATRALQDALDRYAVRASAIRSPE